ncbi:MAG TPA: Gfo/Idh/MocA family oxidoreductase [Isosphaeraceae bacterium]|jgi:predicted dehydrogenase|nr:Gfo/Idh/MocA family oxidoreductase [Isosphaeraceae bacterium]
MRSPDPLTRRGFLGRSAAALAVPTIVPASALGRAGRLAPSERISLGFIGVGKMNGGHLRHFLGRDEVQVVAVCDVDTKRREHAKGLVEEKYGKAKDKGGDFKGCGASNDFRELLARKDIDAVVIATPDHWHAIPVIEACKAKKDIYCEKPLSLTIREAKAMIDAVRKHDVVFQTGSQQRSEFDGKFRKACEYVRSGRIGKVQVVHVGVGGPSHPCDLPGEPLEPGLDWDRWLGPAPDRPYNSVLSPRGVHNHFPNWRSYREYSGGGMTDFGAHHFDIAQWGLDMDKSGPVEVIPPDDERAEIGVKYRYANGVEMIHGGPSGITFVGTHGLIAVDRDRLESVPASILKEPLHDGDVHLFQSPGHHQNWVDCIRSRKLPICDVEIGARSVTVCHLGNLVYWHRRRLRWDPQAWQFVGDSEANTWLDRDRRDPWQLPTA